MTELMGWMGLYASDGRINADLPAELSGDEIGRVRLVHFESDGHMARLELRHDPLGNKGNTKDTGIHRYDFWNKGRRGHPHSFGMTPALFTYDEDNGILVWEVQKEYVPEPITPGIEASNLPAEIAALINHPADTEVTEDGGDTLIDKWKPEPIDAEPTEPVAEETEMIDDDAEHDSDEPDDDWLNHVYKPIPEGSTL